VHVIIPNIPKLTTKRDIKNFIETTLSYRLRIPFSPAPRIRYCKVLSIESRDGKQDTHGLVKIVPNRAAKWLIQHTQANEKFLLKTKVTAREYFARHPGSRLSDDQERRRDNLSIKVVVEPSSIVLTPSKTTSNTMR